MAYLPSLGEVKLRLTSSGESLDKLKTETNALTENLKTVVGQFIYGYGTDPLEVAVGKMLLERSATLAIAESCTGGYLSHLVTSVPGSSAYFLGSLIPYSYEIKMDTLELNPKRWNIRCCE